MVLGVIWSNEKYPLRRFYIDGNDLAIKMVLERYFVALQDSLWKDKESDSIVFRTVGIAAQFSFLKELIFQKKRIQRKKELLLQIVIL